MQKKNEHDANSASHCGVSDLLERRLAIYREMLCLARNRETALMSDQFSELAIIAAHKAELAAQAARIDNEVRSCLDDLNFSGSVSADLAAMMEKHENDLNVVANELLDIERRFQESGKQRLERMQLTRNKMNAGAHMAKAYGKASRPKDARFVDRKQ